MKLCDIFSIMEAHLDHLVDASETRKTNTNRVYTFLNAFLDDADDDKNPIYSKTEDFIRKVYRGAEPLPVDCAQFYLAHLSSMAFEEFISGIEDSVMFNIIDELGKHDEHLTISNFAEDFTELMRRTLYNIVNFPESSSIRYADFIGENKVKIGDKTLNLPPELVTPDATQMSENKYVDALLEVYSHDTNAEIHSVADLQALPLEYSKHFKMQRQYFYSAESVLHQIRDIFKDGITEFNALKKETYEGVETLLLVPCKTGVDKINKVLIHVTILNYSKSYLGRPNNGLIGPSEKQGIIHMLVNDGKIEWLVNDDETI